VYVAVERLPELAGLKSCPRRLFEHLVPASRRRDWTREEALVELLRGRVSFLGPATADEIGHPLRIDASSVHAALETLEAQGACCAGASGPDAQDVEWCERGLLARIHRYTLNRLRAEIEPVSPAGYMRFLFEWQHVGARRAPVRARRPAADRPHAGWIRAAGAGHGKRRRAAGAHGPLRPIVARHALPDRAGRLGAAVDGPTQVVGATPVALFSRARGRMGWFVLLPTGDGPPWDAAIEQIAWILLRRYGVVFRRVLAREALAVPWRDLARVYRRLEARGEIRGGRFVSGMSGEQFALPDAVERLREVRRAPSETTLLTISAADPLNLTGIITPGDRIRAVAASRIVYRNGVPLAALEGDLIRTLAEVEPALAADVAAAAAGRAVPVVTGYVGARHR
jgi:hypothetical protein